MSENNGTIKNLVAKTLFVIGIIIVIMILAFAIIRIIPRLFSSFATVGDAVRSPLGNKGLVIEGPSRNIDSGDTAILTWEYEPREGGLYEFSYECIQYLDLVMGTSEGNKILTCDKDYNIAPTAKSISLIPTLSRENILVDLSFNISYINSDGEILTNDSIEITVKRTQIDDLAGTGTVINSQIINPSSVDNNSQPTNTNIYRNSNTATRSTNSGLPDLAISNLFDTADTIVVFTVSNIGSNVSGPWYFNYRMPDGDLAGSPMQNSLRPGESILYTLRFEDVPDGNVTISVDPYNIIRESSDINNVAAVRIEGDNGNGNSSVDYDEDDDADLEIDEFEVGRMNGSRFTEDDEIDEDDDAAIRFVVVNSGGERTGSWRFSVDNTPYDDDDDFESKRQDSLDPGESRTIVVEFESPDEGEYDIEIEVDSRDDVDEENERNNKKRETLVVEED